MKVSGTERMEHRAPRACSTAKKRRSRPSSARRSRPATWSSSDTKGRTAGPGMREMLAVTGAIVGPVSARRSRSSPTAASPGRPEASVSAYRARSVARRADGGGSRRRHHRHRRASRKLDVEIAGDTMKQRLVNWRAPAAAVSSVYSQIRAARLLGVDGSGH